MEKVKTVRERDLTDKLWDKGVEIVTSTAYFISGFILSGAQLFEMKIPLSIGLAAACKGREMIFACAGAVLGSFFRLDTASLVSSVAPLAGMAGVSLALEKLRITRRNKLILALSAGILYFAASTAVMFSGEATLSGLLLNLCAALLCGSSVIFYSGTAECIRKKHSLYMLDNYSLICLVMSLCTLLLGSSEISILGFRPARFFGSFIIICAAYLFGPSGGSIAGISIGACIAVSGTGIALSLCCGISGLVSGIFSKYGQFAAALVFSLATGAAALIDSSAESLAVFAETALACVIFSLIPKKYLSGIRTSILNPKSRRVAAEFSGAKERIMQASRAIGSVSECVSSVSKGIEALAPAKDILVCMRVRERICSGCQLKNTFCPENGEFAEIMQKLADGITVTPEDFSVNFNSKCPSVPRLAESFNKIYSSQNAVTALQANAARSRELACSQFDWISQLLCEFSETLEAEAQTLYGKERTAQRVLSEYDFKVISTNCTQPLSGALRLICTVEDIPSGTSLSHLTANLSAELGAELSPPKIREVKAGRELRFIQKERFGVSIASSGASCGNRKLCGDYCEHFRTESKAYIILSDGMGTGGRAAIDSAMTVELFSRLIRAGLSLDTALSITNSALSVKSDDESISTLDVAEIDLFSGDAVILKAGAAQSFYTCSGRVKAVEVPSTPLGILSKVAFSRYSLRLRGGDRLIMVSDGILGCGTGWIQDEIRAADSASPSEISELILEEAQRKCGDKYDDMTVITAIIEEN